MILNITPHYRPPVWSIRDNWLTKDNGLHYDPHTGELFSLSDSQYVEYIGRLPESVVNQSQMELL
jgi:hypothetical protein